MLVHEATYSEDVRQHAIEAFKKTVTTELEARVHAKQKFMEHVNLAHYSYRPDSTRTCQRDYRFPGIADWIAVSSTTRQQCIQHKNTSAKDRAVQKGWTYAWSKQRDPYE